VFRSIKDRSLFRVLPGRLLWQETAMTNSVQNSRPQTAVPARRSVPRFVARYVIGLAEPLP